MLTTSPIHVPNLRAWVKLIACSRRESILLTYLFSRLWVFSERSWDRSIWYSQTNVLFTPIMALIKTISAAPQAESAQLACLYAFRYLQLFSLDASNAAMIPSGNWVTHRSYKSLKNSSNSGCTWNWCVLCCCPLNKTLTPEDVTVSQHFLRRVLFLWLRMVFTHFVIL